METKRNLKYFTTNGVSPLTIVGWVVLAVSVLFLVISGRSLRLYAILGSVVGIGILIFAGSGKASGDDIEYQAGEKVKDMIEYGMKRFELFEKHLKFLQPLILRGYEFNDEVHYKKGSDGRNRTSMYSAAVLFFTGERINIHHRHFSFIDDSIDEELGGSYKYIDLDHAEVQSFPFERQIGKRLYKFTDYHFVLFGKDGQEVFNISVDYGADIDKACADINRVIDVRTKAHYEKLARVEADRKARLEEAAAAATAEAANA